MRRVELLNASHDRASFDCGNQQLNNFLQTIARQHLSKGLSRTFVMVDSELPSIVLGYFTLAICEVQSDSLPARFVKKYPGRVAGVKLARIAVSIDRQRQGLGAMMMSEVFQRVSDIADLVGVVGLFVDAKDSLARSYYSSYGFDGVADESLFMFLSIGTIQQLVKEDDRS